MKQRQAGSLSDIFGGDFLKLHLWLINFIGVLVPRRLRADWRQEQFECGMRNAECGIESNTGIRRLG